MMVTSGVDQEAALSEVGGLRTGHFPFAPWLKLTLPTVMAQMPICSVKVPAIPAKHDPIRVNPAIEAIDRSAPKIALMTAVIGKMTNPARKQNAPRRGLKSKAFAFGSGGSRSTHSDPNPITSSGSQTHIGQCCPSLKTHACTRPARQRRAMPKYANDFLLNIRSRDPFAINLIVPSTKHVSNGDQRTLL